MKWDQVCEDKLLQDLPYKIELNEWGNIVMSPVSNRHGNLQTKIAFHLMSHLPDGTVLTDFSPRGKMEKSLLFPEMLAQIKADA